METMPERSRTACSTTAKRLSRGNRFRKALGSLPSKTWQSDMLPQNSNYVRDFTSDHHLKLTEGKSSDDSAVDIDTTEQINYLDYETKKLPRDFGYKIGNPSHRTPGEDVDQFPADSCGVMQPKSRIIAEEKLKRLKDLQRKREFNEFYYSQEIRKLISEYYRRSENSGDSINKKEQICTPGTQGAMSSDQTTSSILKALEPCGTMTTITRLDCGCMQETTRPIFTTSNGRVENRNCRHGQDSVLLKLASSNPPREYLSSSNFIERRKLIGAGQNSSVVIKHRPPGVVDSRIVQTRTSADAVYRVKNSNRKLKQGSNSTRCNLTEIKKSALNRRPETVSSSFIRDNPERRNLSPLRKYSDTSTD